MRRLTDQRFEQVDRRFDRTVMDLLAVIREEGERTRRHSQILFEELSDRIRLMAEGLGGR
jgi:hypothetical protein